MFTNYIILSIFLVGDIVLFWLAWHHYITNIKHKTSDTKDIFNELNSFSKDDYNLKFEDINKIFNNNQTWNVVWSDFKSTLTRNTINVDYDELYSPVDAGEFFCVSAVTKDINISYWQNFSGTFTGVGILGTFLGLVLGLSGVDLASSDVTVLKEGIGALLNGISVAFGTSLLGISFALGYGYINKRQQDALSESVLVLANRVEKMYPRKNVEQWLSDVNRESVEQTKAIKNLATETAESLAELLDNQLSTGFNELCEQLDAQMRPVFEKLYEAIYALNEGGANAIAGAVNEKTGAQLDAFAQTLQHMQESMQQSLDSSTTISAKASALLTETMEKIGTSITQGTDEAVKKQQAAAESMSNQMQNLVQYFSSSSEQAMMNMLNASTVAQKGLHDSVEQTKTSANMIVDSMENVIKKQSDLMQSSTENNNKRIDEMMNMLQKMIKDNSEQTMSNMLNTSQLVKDSLNNSVEQTKESAQSIVNSMESVVQKQSNLLQQATESNSKRIDETVSMLQQIIKEHSSVIGQSYIAIKDMALTLEQLLEKLDVSGKNLKDSVSPIQEATDGLKLQLHIIQNNTNKLHEEIGKQLDDMAKQGVESRKLITDLSGTINDAQKQAFEAWSEYNLGFRGIGDELNTVLNSISDKLANYNQIMNDGMKKHLSEFDGEVAQATGQLKSVIEELNDMIEDLIQQRYERK